MGALSIILAICAANGAVLALLVVAIRQNRAANRFLSLLIGLIALRLMIYVLGFAGAYDAAPWLTFLPLDASLAFGPLLWLYIDTLTRGSPTAGWPLHLAPAAIQMAYQAIAFCLPLPAKWDWYTGPHLHLIAPTVLGLILISSGGYLWLAWQSHRRYQAWLNSRFADRDPWRLTWLRIMLIAFAAALAMTLVLTLWNFLVSPLDYFHRVPVMFGFSLLAYVLGLLGWRHGGTAYPHPGLAEPEASEPERRIDYAALFAEWHARVAAAGWWREEQVTLGEIARRLAVSERTLSRGLRDGGGTNFNLFINGMRVAAVQRQIQAGVPGDLLSLALECGFNSKASFNRAFKAATGQTPTGWRRASQFPPIVEQAAI